MSRSALPQLIMLCGLPGAGKTTLAASLVTSIREGRPVICLDRDQLRAERISEPRYNEREKQQLRAWLIDEARRNLLAGISVLIDGMTFARQRDRRPFARLAEGLFLPAVWLWLDLDADQARQRIAHDREHPAADRTPALVTQVLGRYAPVPPDWCRLDANQAPDQVHAQALHCLRQGTARPLSEALGC